MAKKSWLNVVLLSPEIPGNTGSIGRTCLALNIRLILIRPYGFDLSEKSVRRAGLDYWKHIKLTEYNDWKEFLESESPKNLIALSARASTSFFEQSIKEDSYLIFGGESKGLPEEIKNSVNSFALPIINSHIRSLNLSNTVTACCYEAFRQISPI